jgi:hypothetical protein
MTIAKTDKTHGLFAWTEDRYRIASASYRIVPTAEAEAEDSGLDLVTRMLIVMQNTLMDVCEEQGWKQELQEMLDAEWAKHLGKSYSAKEMHQVYQDTWDIAIHQFGLRHPEINRPDGPLVKKLEQIVSQPERCAYIYEDCEDCDCEEGSQCEDDADEGCEYCGNHCVDEDCPVHYPVNKSATE